MKFFVYHLLFHLLFVFHNSLSAPSPSSTPSLEIVSLLKHQHNTTNTTNTTTVNHSTTYHPLSIQGTTPRKHQLRQLLEWLRHHKAHFPKVGVSASTSTGAGGFTVGSKIKRNEQFIKIPQPLIITPTFAARTVPALRALQKEWTVNSLEESYNKDKVMIAFYLLFQIRLTGFEKSSFFQPYLDSCPIHYNDFPLFWKQKDIDLLQASRLKVDIANEKTRMLRDFRRGCTILKTFFQHNDESNELYLACDEILLDVPYSVQQRRRRANNNTNTSNPQMKDLFETKTRHTFAQCGNYPSWGTRSKWSTFQWYMWSRTVISSRSWRVFLRGQAPKDKSGKNPQCSSSSLALVPLADLLNHRKSPGTHWTFDPKSKHFIVKATTSHEVNSPIYDSYGMKKNNIFLINFGFVSDSSAFEASMIFPPLDVHKIITQYKNIAMFSRKEEEEGTDGTEGTEGTDGTEARAPGTTEGGHLNGHFVSSQVASMFVNVLERLEQSRLHDWNHEHRRHTISLSMNDFAHNMLGQLKQIAPKEIGTPPHGWVGRTIMAVASARLALYPTSIREDRLLLKKDVKIMTTPTKQITKPFYTYYQQNAIKVRIGEKRILKSWLRFGYVLHHNFHSRPHRITIAITVDSHSPSVLNIHTNTLQSLADRLTAAAKQSDDDDDDTLMHNHIYVGMPIFARWGNEYYDGSIVAKYTKPLSDAPKQKKDPNKDRIQTKQTPQQLQELKGFSYHVQFYDGDFKTKTPLHTLVTYPEKYLKSPEYTRAVQTSTMEVPSALSGVCFIVTSGYWSYEVCVGHQIIQYHHNSDGTRGNIILLGKYVDVSSIVLNCNEITSTFSSTKQQHEGDNEGNPRCTESTNTYQSNSHERSIHFEGSDGGTSGASGASGGSTKSESSNDNGPIDSFQSSLSAAQGKHAYRQFFRDGEDGRQVEVVFVCRREKDPLLRKRAGRGESHSMKDLTETDELRNHRIVREYLHANGNARSTGQPFSELSTGRIVHIDEPELLSYRIVIGTESACIGLVATTASLVQEIRDLDAVVNDEWIVQHQFGSTSSSSTVAMVDPFSSISSSDESSKDPLLFQNMKNEIVSVMTTKKGEQTWAKAFIEKLNEDASTYSVNFDDYNMKRDKVPMTEILPIPKELMKLPCWLFQKIPGGGCD